MRAALLALLPLSVYAGTVQPPGIPFKAPVTVATGFTARVLFSNLTTPRGITLDANQNVLVVERGLGVTAFSPAPRWGIQVDDEGHLYVSTAGQVLVYSYDAGSKTVSGEACVVISGIPPDGDLTTHTLQLQKEGNALKLLVATGPQTNIDPTARNPSSGRSQIRRFVLPAGCPATPLDWATAEILVYGIRNPGGFAFHPTLSNTLYVVENGASIDNVTDLTAAFVNDNPADEINRVHLGGHLKFFGFPDCTTLWNPTADPTGDPQYTTLQRGDQISLKLLPERDDAWCSDPKNNVPPALTLQAHSVPLDIKFYHPPKKTTDKSFPRSLHGDAVVSFHGSFNRSPPTGYGVVHVPFPLSDTYDFLIQATNLTSCPGKCIRPVGLAFSNDGRLFVSSDSSGEVCLNCCPKFATDTFVNSYQLSLRRNRRDIERIDNRVPVSL
ncbi:NHL repeat-containing protein [Mycena indigotica]|uniref:NHL repeat-containing protein n=1 Tax=Mycena indigotica TaxID=2126181 RepID=A0A8H6T064_9AGAR|nr:NHL repeat-containing protein [Mycena indigotica]KAF7307527.1 NHL repeat-containing protein [Mycena indigotica]